MVDVPPKQPIVLSDVMPRLAAPNTSGNRETPVSLGKTTSLEDTRQIIAYILLAALILVIVFSALSSFVYAYPCLQPGAAMAAVCKQAQMGGDTVAKSMGVILTAMIGLVGSVVGFYFGSSSQK